jgi:hypothetical protein
MAEPDLAFIARQLERQTTEIAALRDDIAVLTAISLRHDGSITALLTEFRATHTQIARMNDRMRKLEDAQ